MGRIAMKGSDKVLEYLNKVLANELTAINQYFLHARIYGNWGVAKLDKEVYQQSISAMKHADNLIERILFLEGLPNMQHMGKLMVGENTSEMLGCDLKLESLAIPLLREAIVCCEKSKDYVTREVFASILECEEGYVDWLETQIELIDKVGVENYLQSQI